MQTLPPKMAVTETTDENAQNADDAESTDSFVSYTVTQDELTDEVLAKVVASCGDRDLTNRDARRSITGSSTIRLSTTTARI